MTYDPLTPPPVHWEHAEKFSPVQGQYDPDAERAARDKAKASVAAGYVEHVTDEARQASKASAWRFDAQLDQLDKLRTTDAAAFARMPAVSKVALGLYLDGKAAASAAGIDTTGRN